MSDATTERSRPDEDGVLQRLSLLDRFLTLWIFAAMGLGIALGFFVPSFTAALQQLSVGTTSIPIAIGLVAMMYPPFTKVRYEELGKVFRNRRVLVLSLVQNWVIGPVLMFALAVLFLPDKPDYMPGLILIGLARCIAMVIVWNDLAKGDSEYCAGLVAFNSLSSGAVLPPSRLPSSPRCCPPGWASRRVGHHVSTGRSTSVAIYLGIPCAAGYLTRKIWLSAKGRRWYEQRRSCRASAPSRSTALLFTIVVMFSPQGRGDRAAAARRAAHRAAAARVLRGDVRAVAVHEQARGRQLPERTATLSLTAAGNNFELAIAVSVGVWGVTSGQALAGVVGPLIEVPVLVALVYVSLWLRRRLTFHTPTTVGSTR